VEGLPDLPVVEPTTVEYLRGLIAVAAVLALVIGGIALWLALSGFLGCGCTNPGPPVA
jgi:hypothetical protein